MKVDRETGVVRVLRVAAAHDSGTILNRLGADGQVLGGVVMGVGLALSEGTMLDDQGRQRNPHLLDYKLLTCSDAPADRRRLDPVRLRRAARLEGRRRAAAGSRPPGAIANAISKVIGRHVRTAADDARARVGGGAGQTA